MRQKADPGRSRQKHTLAAATFLGGAGEAVDFLLPLFAGVGIGLSPSQIGLLLAAEVAASFITRPIAGSLADRFERRNIAALGAALYGVSCVGYAMTPGIIGAYFAAVVGGIGGALLWVALRAIISERLVGDSGVFAKLAVAEETGSWAVFVPILLLVGVLDYEVVFIVLAGLSSIGSIALLTAPRLSPRKAGECADSGQGVIPDSETGRPLVKRLSPMLVTVALTMTAEGLISLLLLLHLHQEFALAPWQIGLVFLPGGIAMGVLPPFLHGLVRRYGRSKVLAAASVASAGFAFSLAFAPNPVVIAICWILAGAAWAVVIPEHQAVIAEASGENRLGRGLGWYESAALAGALLGTACAGIIYEVGSWGIACLVASAVILTGAFLVPAALRTLGVAQYPRVDNEQEPHR